MIRLGATGSGSELSLSFSGRRAGLGIAIGAAGAEGRPTEPLSFSSEGVELGIAIGAAGAEGRPTELSPPDEGEDVG